MNSYYKKGIHYDPESIWPAIACWAVGCCKDGRQAGPKRRVPKRHLVSFACGVEGAKKEFGAFGVFEAWQTARLNAKKKLLVGPWCLCLQGWGCQKGIDVALMSLPAGLGVPKRHLEGLEGLEGLRPGKRQA